MRHLSLCGAKSNTENIQPSGKSLTEGEKTLSPKPFEGKITYLPFVAVYKNRMILHIWSKNTHHGSSHKKKKVLTLP
jgi:hypothetical protein